MNVYKFDIKKNIKDKSYFSNGSFLLLGKFEVFHKGHNELFKIAKSNRKNNEKIGILLIHKESHNFQSLDNKLDNLASLKFDFVIIAIFNFEFKSLDGKEFIKYLNKQFNIKKFFTGDDFKFGRNRQYSAIDIKNIVNTDVEIISILKNNSIKIATRDIKEMHELGEYNLIKEIIVNPLKFNIKIINKNIKWDDEAPLTHFGNYYFKILISNYWYHGIIRFSIDKTIYYELINFPIDENMLDQNTTIEIIDVERIIINNRFDYISEDDIVKCKNYFSA